MSGLNNSLHSKVEVHALQSGMFVADLDRDWKGTPFPLQGFLIENDVQLYLLRKYCQFVYVDPVRSTVSISMALASNITTSSSPGLSLAPLEMTEGENNGDVRQSTGEPPRAPALVIPRRTVQIRRGPPLDLTGQADPKAFTLALPRATRSRTRMHDFMNQAFSDVRLGSSINTEDARLIVSELVDTISENVNAALWLTNLHDKDEYTALHSINVCILSIAFGLHLGIRGEELHILGLGAILHDIGKLKTPTELLNKPGPLTHEEYEVLKRHPVEGHDLILDSGDRAPPMALKIIRNHHEKLAGTGYPDGLRDEEIPLPVLITSVADVYDAITKDRCYNTALPPNRGLQVLYDLAPDNFGRELVEEFISCIGIYPVGSMVELTTGDLGMVLSAEPQRRLKPLIRLVRDPRGMPYDDRQLVNLSEKANSETNWGQWGIKRAIDPTEHAIDFNMLVEDEYALSGIIH